jgi:hypothetical protein
MFANASSTILKQKAVLRQNPPAPVSFTANANSQDYTLFGMPPKFVVCGIRVTLVTTFTAFALTACSLSIGANPTTGTGPSTWVKNFFTPSFSLIQSAGTFQYWSPFVTFTLDPYDITATVTTTNAQVSDITAGEVDITILYQAI